MHIYFFNCKYIYILQYIYLYITYIYILKLFTHSYTRIIHIINSFLLLCMHLHRTLLSLIQPLTGFRRNIFTLCIQKQMWSKNLHNREKIFNDPSFKLQGSGGVSVEVREGRTSWVVQQTSEWRCFTWKADWLRSLARLRVHIYSCYAN